MAIVINYTVVANNAMFGGLVSSIVMSVVGTDVTEDLFRLFDESTTREYFFGLDNEIQSDGTNTILRDHIIVRNLPPPARQLVTDTYDINIGAVVLGVQPQGGGQTPCAQPEIIGVIEVIPGE